jgi:hypothetical protein
VTPRERFVEAVADICGYAGDFVPNDKWQMTVLPSIRSAIEAFADAVCEAEQEGRCYPDAASYRLGWRREEMHKSCRSALLKECGLEP